MKLKLHHCDCQTEETVRKLARSINKMGQDCDIKQMHQKKHTSRTRQLYRTLYKTCMMLQELKRLSSHDSIRVSCRVHWWDRSRGVIILWRNQMLQMNQKLQSRRKPLLAYRICSIRILTSKGQLVLKYFWTFVQGWLVLILFSLYFFIFLRNNIIILYLSAANKVFIYLTWNSHSK